MDVAAQLSAALADRYRIEREIGAGGMATVYVARDLRHNRKVALKVLRSELGAILGPERFLSEIETTANLQHPHLLPLFDSGEANGLLFYVMPFVEGESLRARLEREKQLPVEEAVRIAVAIASALDYAHRHNVIHRDLKPENILLHDGQPLVADFGIALAVSKAGGARITQTGLSLGTPQYMSPEQAMGDRVLDARSDIYSLGALVYEMLAGEPPHTGPTSQTVLAKLLTEEVRPLTVLRRTIPQHIDLAVGRSLEKLAADRFATANEFAAALEGRGPVAAAARTPAPRATAGLKVHRFQRVFNSPVTTAAALVVAAVALSGWFATRRRPDPEQPTIRFKLTLPQGMRLGSVIVQSGGSFAVSPDGSVVAFVAVGAGSPQQLYVRGIDDVHPRVLAGTEGAGYPFFSPDGKSIAFISNQVLKKTAVTGGGVITLTERLTGTLQGAAWGPDQNMVLSLGGRLMVMPETGGIPQPILDSASAGGRVARWPRVLPDGKTVLFASSTGSNPTSRIAIGRIGEQNAQVLDLPGINPLGVVDGHLVYAVGAAVTGSIMAVPIDINGRRVIGTPRQVIDRMGIAGTGGVQADLSASGTLMYQTGAAEYQAVLVDPNGATQTIIADPQTYGYARFSPDGKRIAFTITSGSSSDVWVYDLASKTPTRLTTEGGQNDRPEWSPDGKRVLFRSGRSGSGYGLWWQPYDGSGPAEPLVDIPGQDAWQGVFTRDGKTIVYRTGTVGTADLWYRSLAGDTTSRPIANTQFTEWAPQLSPNDKWIAYAADVSGRMQVYVRPFPGAGALTQISLDGGDMPLWSRDGRRLYYVKNDGIVEAALSFDPVVSVTARATILQGDYGLLAGHAAYDIAADDKRLLLLKAVGEAETIIAWNWRSELKNPSSGTRK